MKEWVMVLRAADAAARWHVHQRRKGSAQEPYVNHLLEVASLVADATHGKDPDLVIAALLHDAIEDQEVPRELIEREFGTRVADVVSQVTDGKAQPKDERKKAQVKTAGKKTNDAKIIKLADKTSNMLAITFSPAPSWSVKRRLEYIGWNGKSPEPAKSAHRQSTSTSGKRSHRNWTSITPRKAAKIYQTANWCLRSSGSFGMRPFVVLLRGPALGASPYPSNFRNRQPGADFCLPFTC